MTKTALITGASSGIGAACAASLANRGFGVCLMARRAERLRQISDDINHRHQAVDRAIFFAGDVTSHTDRQAALKFTQDHWAGIDVLVNSAGHALPGVIEEADLEEVREQFEVCTFAALAWMQMVGPIMRRQRSGRIINISSVSGLFSIPGLGIYAASKFALEAISDAARREYRPWGVKVILIEPSSVVTEIWARSQDIAAARDLDWSASPFRHIYQMHRQHAEKLIAGHGPSAEIVARAVCHAATARAPRPRYRMPLEAKIIKLLTHLPTRVQDWLIARTFKDKDTTI